MNPKTNALNIFAFWSSSSPQTEVDVFLKVKVVCRQKHHFKKIKKKT